MASEPKPFAKLFETEFGQVLCTTEFDDEKETHGVCFRGATLGGVVPAVTYGGWSDEAEADEALARTDQERADEAAKMLRGIVAGFVK